MTVIYLDMHFAPVEFFGYVVAAFLLGTGLCWLGNRRLR